MHSVYSDYTSEIVLYTLRSIREYTLESLHGAPEGPWWENRDSGCVVVVVIVVKVVKLVLRFESRRSGTVIRRFLEDEIVVTRGVPKILPRL